MPKLKKILYIDDDPDQRAFIEAFLPAIGDWQVSAVDEAAQALQAVNTFAPDLILLDVVMPEMDGPATLEYLRSSGITLPVVFVSAQNDPAEITRLRQMDCQGVLIKPFDPENLQSRIEAIWQETE